MFSLMFTPCSRNALAEICKSEQDIKAFLDKYRFSLVFYANYIDFDDVTNDTQPLKTKLKAKPLIKLDTEKKVELLIEMDEYRARLYDDNINLMGLSEPTEINYLNYSGRSYDYPIEFDANNATLGIFFQLSS